MHPITKKTYISIALAGLVGLLVLLVVYDRLPKVPGLQRQPSIEAARGPKSNDDLIIGIDQELETLDQQYNFNQSLEEQTPEPPVFE